MSSQEKIRIPHAGHSDLVGILQRAAPEEPTQGRPVALIMHGVLAHKDQVYHKRLAMTLATERGLDSFRYDLRGQGGESEGPWTMADFGDDADDLGVVVDYLTTQLGYRLHVIIAHSRGSMVSGYYLCCRPHPPIPLWVNISGRWDMTRILKDPRYTGREFWDTGEMEWRVRVAGQELVRTVTTAGVLAFAQHDNSFLLSSFPQDVDVLTVHGSADKIVPVADAFMYHKILSQRSPGTHTLSIVEGETHNYTRPYDEPVNSILMWLQQRDTGLSKAQLAKM